jgi:MoaA/NifB/PqqE/SkfB family radical SAM enzyme
MRFPLRLSAALLKTRVASIVGGSSASRQILHLVPDGNALAHAASAAAPVVWLGGADALLHPEVGRITDALVGEGRHVFLYSDGYNLGKRLHAFRPDSRLFLTLEFAGREETHNRAIGRPDAFRRSIEGIRAAKLSGFLVAAHFTVTSEADSCGIGELIEFLDKSDVDGFVVTSRGRALAPGNASLSETLEDVRAMIRCGRWENFSRILEASYAATAANRAPQEISTPGEGAYEEGD